MDNIYISRVNWDKIIHYAQSAYDEWKTEIGGMAIVFQDKDDDWVIEDPVILKQKVSGGNTHLDAEALAQYYTKTAYDHRDKKNLQFLWWHSHHTMGAFWSGTDLATIDEFNKGDMSMSLVVNLKEEYKFRVNVWHPIEVHKDIEINIEGKDERKVPKSITKEVKALCEEDKPTYVRSNYNGWGANVNGQASLFKVKKEDVVDIDQAIRDKDEELFNFDPRAYLDVKLNAWIARAVDGTLNYNQFKYRLNKLANLCAEHSVDDEFRIVIPTKKTFERIIETASPDTFYVDMEMQAYNMGYGI